MTINFSLGSKYFSFYLKFFDFPSSFNPNATIVKHNSSSGKSLLSFNKQKRTNL